MESKAANTLIRYREACRLLRTRYFGWVREMFLDFSTEICGKIATWSMDDVFELKIHELRSYLNNEFNENDLAVAVQRRRETRRRIKKFPSLLSVDSDNKTLPLTPETKNAARSELSGLLVSGRHGEGKVLVVNDPMQIATDQPLDDHFLVTPATDPAWVYLLPKCKGIISERGNALSHLAIIARELKKTMLVQVEGACQTLKTDQRISLSPEGSIEVIESR